MAYDKTWGMLTERVRGAGGIYYKFSSTKGEATAMREKHGWAIRGMQTSGRTDARPIVEMQVEETYDWTKGVPSADYYETEQYLGRFVVEGLANYQAVQKVAYHHLALMPVRVPFSSLDDGTAEANRDKMFLKAQMMAVKRHDTHAQIEDPQIFYAQIVEMEAKEKVKRERQRPPRDT